jgi:hypothetical protein
LRSPALGAAGLQMRVAPSAVVVHEKPVGHGTPSLHRRVQYESEPSRAQMSLRQSVFEAQSSPRPPASPTHTETAPAEVQVYRAGQGLAGSQMSVQKRRSPSVAQIPEVQSSFDSQTSPSAPLVLQAPHVGVAPT